MRLNDIFESIKKRRLRYCLFMLQMVIIFCMLQYTQRLIYNNIIYNNKLSELEANSNNCYYSTQSTQQDECPECSFDEYNSFRKKVNEKCGNTAFSFSSSDIILSDTKIPDKLSVVNEEMRLYKATYVSENFLDYYGIKSVEGRLFSTQEYDEISPKYIPIIVGNDYSSYLKVGDIIDEKYVVIGVLCKNSSYLDSQLNTDLVYLDDQFVIPMIYQAKEWGGCYVSHLYVTCSDSSKLMEINELMKEYGFNGFELRALNDQVDLLYEYFKTELSFMGAMVSTALIIGVFSLISMLLHLIEEQKKEFGVHLLCGASKIDIAVRICLPVIFVIIISSVPSIIRCKTIWEIGSQLGCVMLILVVCLTGPIVYWLKKPICELKKERR